MGLGSLPGRWRANNGLNVINDENENKKEDVMTNRFLLSGWRIKDELGIKSESGDLD